MRGAESHSVPDDLMLEPFQQHLPTRVQSILAAISPLTLEKAAEVADRVMEVTPIAVNLGLRRIFQWTFLVGNVSTPIIGADFLYNFRLVPDIKNFLTSQKPPRPDQEIKHSVVHYIETNSRPVTAKARRLAPDRLRIAKAEFENMITLGHMRPSKTAHLLAPLNKFLEGIENFKKSKKVSCKNLRDSIQWTEEAEQAFNDAKNALADATLLRHPIPDFEALSKAQLEDNELQSFQNDEKSSLVFKRVPSPVSATELICDISTGSPRPFVPHNFRRTIFEHFYNLAHPGVAASFQLIASRYVWPNMREKQ
ncbi:retrovirus-related Pol polyprotein from transposon opus [Trichonephila clavipes]|nr:retrovirus-related Pol polyprotein from transposon opus [Trichonephila clavipes]